MCIPTVYLTNTSTQKIRLFLATSVRRVLCIQQWLL